MLHFDSFVLLPNTMMASPQNASLDLLWEGNVRKYLGKSVGPIDY